MAKNYKKYKSIYINNLIFIIIDLLFIFKLNIYLYRFRFKCVYR